MTLTARSTVVALAILNIIKNNQVALALDFVEYGEHTNIPGGQAVTVTSGNKRRTLAGVSGPGGRSLNEMEINITVYRAILDSEANARLAVDQLAEDIEDLIHADTTLGGILTHGFIRDYTPDTLNADGSQYRIVRLTFVGQSKTNITV